MLAVIDNPTITQEVAYDAPIERTAYVQGAQLVNALKAVYGAVPKSSPKWRPIDSTILLSTPEGSPTDVSGSLRVTATNHDMYISSVIPAVADMGISIALPARLFRDAVKGTGETKLTQNVKPLSVTITQARRDNTVKGYPGCEFPVLPDTSSLPLQAVIPLALLKRAIKEAVPSCWADKKIDKPQLSSVYMEVFVSGSILLCGADGSRLAILGGYTSDDGPSPKHIKVMIPAASFAELDMIDSEHVSVYLSSIDNVNRIVFRGQSVEVGIRLTDGKYVDIARILPNGDNPTRAQFMALVDDILETNKVIMPFAKEASNISRWDYQENGTQYSTLTMSAFSEEVGDALGRVRAFCTPTDSEPVTAWISIDASFVKSVLTPHKGKQVVVELVNENRPAVFRIDDDLMLLIMPTQDNRRRN